MRIFAPIALSLSVLISSLSAWNDYQINKRSRIETQQLIWETFAAAIRQPLIQGSYIEAKIRANELEKNKQVACINITTPSEEVVNCRKNLSEGSGLNRIESDLLFNNDPTKSFAHLTIVFDNSDLIGESWTRVSKNTGGFIFLAAILYAALLMGFSRIKIELTELIKIVGIQNGKHEISNFKIKEFSSLGKSLIDLMEIAKSEAESKAALDVAKQVAHDIRSPIISLQVAVHAGQNQLDPEIKRVLNHSAQRISDIADEIINQHLMTQNKGDFLNSAQKLPMSVNLALTEMLSEKAIVCKQMSDVSIHLNSNMHNALIEMRVSDFKRIISNLIDNAIQAVSDHGRIEVNCVPTGQECCISITDNGCGISEVLLPTILEKGGSFGKPSGKGLGLQWTKKTIEQHGGKFLISSKENVGTEVKIFLPTLNQNLNLPNNPTLSLIVNEG